MASLADEMVSVTRNLQLRTHIDCLLIREGGGGERGAKKKEGRFLSLILFVVEESRDDKRLSLSGEEKLVNRQSARHPPIYLLLQTPSS